MTHAQNIAVTLGWLAGSYKIANAEEMIVRSLKAQVKDLPKEGILDLWYDMTNRKAKLNAGDWCSGSEIDAWKAALIKHEAVDTEADIELMDEAGGPGTGDWVKIAAAAGTDIRDSAISGKGLFATRSFTTGDVLVTDFMQKQNTDDPRTRWEQSDSCRYTNHSDKPNAFIRKLGETVELVADETIQPNEEITCNYRDASKTLGKAFFYTYRGKPYGNATSEVSFMQKTAATLPDTFYGLPTFLKQAQTTDDILDRIANARAQTATEVSDGNATAGNYRKGRFNYHGLRISIENPKGSMRSGTAADGTRWSNKMKFDYGYIRGTTGADGDPVDVFIGDDPKSEMVYVINQVNKSGSFDEHKVVLGALDAKQAKQTYLSNYKDGWTGCGSVIGMTMQQFKAWLQGDVTKPAESIKQAADLGTPELPWRDRVEVFARKPDTGEIYGGRWDADKSFALPGGGIDPGEDAATAAMREFMEETGIPIVNARKLDVPSVDNPWSDAHRQRTGRNFAGARTHFIQADIAGEQAPGKLDVWNAGERGYYSPEAALQMMLANTNYMAPASAQRRIEILQGMQPQPAGKVKQAAIGTLQPWQTALGGAVLGGGAGGLADYLTGADSVWDGVIGGAVTGGLVGHTGNPVINAVGRAIGAIENKSSTPGGVSLSSVLPKNYEEKARQHAEAYRKTEPRIPFKQRIDPDSLSRKVKVTNNVEKHMVGNTAATASYNPLTDTMNVPRGRTDALPHELTHAAQSYAATKPESGIEDLLLRSATDRAISDPSLSQYLGGQRGGRRETEAYLADIKRKYFTATGKHVKTPEDAAKAIQWRINEVGKTGGRVPLLDSKLFNLSNGTDTERNDVSAWIDQLIRIMPGLVQKDKPVAGVKQAGSPFAALGKVLKRTATTASRVPVPKVVRNAVLPTVKPNPALVAANSAAKTAPPVVARPAAAARTVARPQPAAARGMRAPVRNVATAPVPHPTVAAVTGKLRGVRDTVANVPKGEAFSQRPIANTSRLAVLDGVPGMRLVNRAALGAAGYTAGSHLLDANNAVNGAIDTSATQLGDYFDATPEQRAGFSGDLYNAKWNVLQDQTLGAAGRGVKSLFGGKRDDRVAAQDAAMRAAAMEAVRRAVHAPEDGVAKPSLLRRVLANRSPVAVAADSAPTLMQQLVDKPSTLTTAGRVVDNIRRSGVDVNNPTAVEQALRDNFGNMYSRLTPQQLNKLRRDIAIGTAVGATVLR